MPVRRQHRDAQRRRVARGQFAQGSAAAQLGLSVPQDLSIMGFDNLTVISQTLRPSLTTVALPYFEIGRMAVEMVKLARDEPDGWAPKVLVPCPLVIRESCRALN